MESTLAEGILIMCRVLNAHNVQYMFVGGTAVALHGYNRLSLDDAGTVLSKPDIDIWYNPSYPNYFRLLDAIEALGNDVKAFKDETSPDPERSFFRYEFDKFKLDLLPKIKVSLKFRLAFERKCSVGVGETEIPYISLDDLIADKRINARPKDLVDIAELERLGKR